MQEKKAQGWINYYRKPFLTVGVLILLYIWFFTKPIFEISEPLADLLEGFGTTLMFIGAAGRVFASLTISGRKNHEVVDSEVYSIVRHPLYFFSFLMLVGFCLLISRIEVFVVAIFIFIICFFPMMKNEEKFLEKKFGQNYVDYKNKTPFFIPKLSLYKARKNLEIDFGLVRKTLLDALVAISIIPLIELVQFINYLL